MFNPLFLLLVFLGWFGSLDAGQFSLAAGIVIGMADSCLPGCLQSLPVLAAVQLHRAIVRMSLPSPCPLKSFPATHWYGKPLKLAPDCSVYSVWDKGQSTAPSKLRRKEYKVLHRVTILKQRPDKLLICIDCLFFPLRGELCQTICLEVTPGYGYIYLFLWQLSFCMVGSCT